MFQKNKLIKLTILDSVFQPFSSRGTSQQFLIIRRNLNTPYSTIYSIFKEPSEKLAEPRWKNTDLGYKTFVLYLLQSLFNY